MDILNFISWIRGGRKVASVDPNKTLIPVGLKDDRRDDEYLAGAITVADLAAQIAPPPPTYTNCNIPLGPSALDNVALGANNIGIGCSSLLLLTNGFNNTAIGTNTLTDNDANNNIGIGAYALKKNTTGPSNIGIGVEALYNNTAGDTNIGIGDKALYNNSIGNQNTAVGNFTMEAGTGRSQNTAIGFASLRFNEGSRNIALGNAGIDSGFAAASDNISIGNFTFSRLTTGANNIGIGSNVMVFCLTGSNNIAIGNNADSINFSNSVIIGNGAVATADNQFSIGTAANNVGSVTSEVNTSGNVWNVVINGVPRKILLA